MKTPREKYLSDSRYRTLVKSLWGQLENCYFTPSELREAAILASILYEEHHIGRKYISISIPPKIEAELKSLHEWTTEEPE